MPVGRGEDIVNYLIGRGAKIWPGPLNTGQNEAVTVSLFLSPAMPSTTPTHRHFALSPVSLGNVLKPETTKRNS